MQTVIKSTCFEQSSDLVLKMRDFEDFRERVLKGLQEWDKKAIELSDLGAKYYGEIEESRRIFLSMR
jgi:hypothetical protein